MEMPQANVATENGSRRCIRGVSAEISCGVVPSLPPSKSLGMQFGCRVIRSMIFVMCYVVFATMIADGATADEQHDALRALDGVLVSIEMDAITCKRLSVSKSEVEDYVNRTLQRAGIRNLSKEAPVRQGAAQLIVALAVADDAAGGAQIVSIRTMVREPVLLVRDLQRTLVATTWQARPNAEAIVANTKAHSARGQVWQFLNNQLDEFVLDFRAANGPAHERH
jgi:hypothetical protein